MCIYILYIYINILQTFHFDCWTTLYSKKRFFGSLNCLAICSYILYTGETFSRNFRKFCPFFAKFVSQIFSKSQFAKVYLTKCFWEPCAFWHFFWVWWQKIICKTYSCFVKVYITKFFWFVKFLASRMFLRLKYTVLQKYGQILFHCIYSVSSKSFDPSLGILHIVLRCEQ